MRWLILAAFLGALAACAQTSRQMRAHTYPRSFDYITRNDVQDSMLQLALRVQRLDALLRADAPPQDETRRGEAVSLLADMETMTQQLSRGGAVSNHPEFNARLSQFTSDLRAARQAVQAEPANFFLAGAVVGSCTYCHR